MTIFLDYQHLKNILPSLAAYDDAIRLLPAAREELRQRRNRLLLARYPGFIGGNNAYGKPIAKNEPSLSFNHSHSQKYYALAYSEDVQDLGIDIEDFSRNVRMHALAQHAFHPDEIARWQATDFDPAFWFRVWTIKEAVLKAHGLGIRLSLKDLNSHAHPSWDFGVVDHPELGQFTYQCLQLPNSMLTVAYRQQDLTLQSLHFLS
ncbi:4'-phosphopantetheinyl transferase family protein [Acinetobacter puyangensis]|uniref:4'-phosphopantetheinyl transferase family protein n=1 Tax=Acinetobacter puyangensis TaxID=1096779 RepID=UPI003A4D2EF0